MNPVLIGLGNVDEDSGQELERVGQGVIVELERNWIVYDRVRGDDVYLRGLWLARNP
jgi:hypothetical protein